MNYTPKLLHALLLALLVTDLVGCAPQPIPEWAMVRHELSRKAPRHIAAPYRPAHERDAALQTDDLEMFSPEWYARERRRDEELKRKFNICRGC